MPGSIRDRISAFENMASSSIAKSQLMPIVPPTPGFSATKKVEKRGVRAKETSRIIPFEYTQKSYVFRDDRHEINQCDDRKSECTRDNTINYSYVLDEADEANDDTDMDTRIGRNPCCLNQQKNNATSSVSGSSPVNSKNDEKIYSDSDDSFGEFISGEEKYESNQIDHFVQENHKADIAMSKLKKIELTTQNDDFDEIEELEKISLQHRNVFDYDVNQNLAIALEVKNEACLDQQQTEEFECDCDDKTYDDDVSDLLGVDIEEESTVSNEQDLNSQSIIRPQVRHFKFDDRLTSACKLYSIQEVNHSMLEKDDYGPKKALTPRRNEEQYCGDIGSRSIYSNSCDDLVSQLTENSLDAQKHQSDRKWRTSLDDLKEGSKMNTISTTSSEISSVMTYDLGDVIEENIMIPRRETTQIFRQRNSLAGNHTIYASGSNKIDVSESMISEITNPMYEKTSSGIMQSISESEKSSKENSNSFEISYKMTSEGKIHDKFDRSKVVVIRARRGRSERPSERSMNDNPGIDLPKRRFSIRSLSPFRQNKTKESFDRRRPESITSDCNQTKKNEVMTSDTNVITSEVRRRSFSFRSLSPFRKEQIIEDEADDKRRGKNKSEGLIPRSQRKTSPFRRQGITPSEILIQDEEDENSIPLLHVASDDVSLDVEKVNKFSLRSLSPFRRRQGKK